MDAYGNAGDEESSGESLAIVKSKLNATPGESQDIDVHAGIQAEGFDINRSTGHSDSPNWVDASGNHYASDHHSQSVNSGDTSGGLFTLEYDVSTADVSVSGGVDYQGYATLFIAFNRDYSEDCVPHTFPTPIPEPDTVTPTGTLTATPTGSHTATPTVTGTLTATPTNIPSITPFPVITFIPVPTATATPTGSPMPSGPYLKITQINGTAPEDGADMYITASGTGGAPQMPAPVMKAKMVNYNGGQVTFEWEYTITFIGEELMSSLDYSAWIPTQPPEGKDGTIKDVEPIRSISGWTTTTLASNSDETDWPLILNRFRGGIAKIKVLAKDSTGSILGEVEMNDAYFIRGQNPTDQQTKDFINTKSNYVPSLLKDEDWFDDPWFLARVARHEGGGYAQFYGTDNEFNVIKYHFVNANHKEISDYRPPNENEIGMPIISQDGGVGQFQITKDPYPTYDDMWNWQSNIKSGVKKLKDTYKIANNKLNQYIGYWETWNTTWQEINPDLGIEDNHHNPPDTTKYGSTGNEIEFALFPTSEQKPYLHAVALKRYNGLGNNDRVKYEKRDTLGNIVKINGKIVYLYINTWDFIYWKTPEIYRQQIIDKYADVEDGYNKGYWDYKKENNIIEKKEPLTYVNYVKKVCEEQP